MRTVPESFEEHVENVRWITEKRLEVIEEIASDSDVSEIVVPDLREAKDRVHQALVVGDREAEDEAIVDRFRAELVEWWKNFPERRILSELFWRAKRSRARSGSRDSRRRPTHPEGLRVAKALLAGARDTSVLDIERESSAVAAVLAYQSLLSPAGCPSCELDDFIERSESNVVYYDALWLVWEVLVSRNEDVPDSLIRWMFGAVFGGRQRPDMKPLAPHRPVNSGQLERDVHVQTVIEILRRVGVPPQGSSVSGCRIVAEALELSEDAVALIWKQRGWAKSYEPMLRKHLHAISERTGLVYANDT